MKGANKEGTDMDAFNDSNNTTIETVIVTNANAANLANNNVSDNFATEIESNNSTNNVTEQVVTIKAEVKPLPKRIDITDIVKDVPKPFIAPVEVSDETDRCEISNDQIVLAKNEVNSKGTTEAFDSIAESKQSLPYKEGKFLDICQLGYSLYKSCKIKV